MEATTLIGIAVIIVLQIVSNAMGLRTEHRLTKLETEVAALLRIANGGTGEIEGE